jgi:hypothetical protein
MGRFHGKNRGNHERKNPTKTYKHCNSVVLSRQKKHAKTYEEFGSLLNVLQCGFAAVSNTHFP